MGKTEVVLLVRFKSALTLEEAMKISRERAPEFGALAGLRQKYYMHDAATGELAGLYLWKSKEDLDSYRRSELRASIARAYHAEEEPRIEVYTVLETLRDESR